MIKRHEKDYAIWKHDKKDCPINFLARKLKKMQSESDED